MKSHKKFIMVFLISIMSLVVTSCSDDKAEKNKNKGDHVWKQQTDTLKAAKEMSKKLQESINQQQKNINDSD